MTDEKNKNLFMQESFELAIKALGMTSPNPLVGSVVIKNGEVIGRGYHRRAGEDHGEKAAIKNALDNGHNVEGADLYCNLEPCCHLNKKTPPCAQFIIEKKIGRVFISNLDPNPQVSGKGVEMLKEAGIDVEFGIMKSQGEELNKIFFHNMTQKRPYIHIKVAQTLDGKISTVSGDSKWISDEHARKEVHRMRLMYDAVAVGSHTLMNDNPSLTIRHGIEAQNKVPYRIVFGHPTRMDFKKNLFNDENKDKTIVVYSDEKEAFDESTRPETTFIKAPLRKDGLYPYEIDLKQALEQLYKFGICSILVEGGSKLVSTFIDQNLYDELSVYIAPKIIGNGQGFYANSMNLSMDKAISFDEMRPRILGNQVVYEYKKGK